MFCIRVIGAAPSDVYAYHNCNQQIALKEVGQRLQQLGFQPSQTLDELADQCFWMRWQLSISYEMQQH